VREHAKSHPPHHDGDALSALLATEHALREQLDAAATEAAKIVADAHARATAAEAGLESAAMKAVADLDAAHERTMRDELAQITAAARADLARFENVPDARIRAMAERVVARVLGA
jgi:vacuolar-type H+-ATPase subunit H